MVAVVFFATENSYMGVAIGQTPAALSRLDAATVRRRARAGEERLSGQAGSGQREEPEVRAGFGAGTLSAQGAALKTVSTNLRRARELVPTVEELQAKAREAAAAAAAAEQARTQTAAERQDVRSADTAAQEPPTLVTALPKAEPQARRFAEENTPVPTPAPVDTANGDANATAPASPASPSYDGASALLDVLA